MLRYAFLLLALGATRAAAAPCDAAPEAALSRECRNELFALERRLEVMLGTLTELHPDVRSVRRSIEEKRQCAEERPAAPDAQAHARIAVDAASPRQAYMGFGATWPWSALAEERITESHWKRAIALLVDDIGARTGTGPPSLELGDAASRKALKGFSQPVSFFATGKLVDLYRRHSPAGLADAFPYANINVRFAHPWLKPMRAEDYRRYLEEVAAKAVGVVEDWKERTGREPEYLQLWNEPISGNNELAGGSHAEIVDTMRVAGRRLREAGHERVRFVVPAEETVKETLAVMRAIAADGEALGTVGAIAYHVYPYGSDYAYVPKLLATRTQGREFEESVRQRLELRRLTDLLRLPAWMTEVSNGYARSGPGGGRDTSAPDSIDWIVGRSIHIHDELRFAGASAFFGMMTVWSDALERDPSMAPRNLRSEGDSLVLVDTAADQVSVSGVGHAMGHFGRWLRRGARYLDATSSHPLVLVSPFRDGERLVAVVVNMARAPVRTSVGVAGAELAGAAAVEQTRTGVCREKLAPLEPRDGVLEIELAPWSVTTLSAPLR